MWRTLRDNTFSVDNLYLHRAVHRGDYRISERGVVDVWVTAKYKNAAFRVSRVTFFPSL